MPGLGGGNEEGSMLSTPYELKSGKEIKNCQFSKGYYLYNREAVKWLWSDKCQCDIRLIIAVHHS